MCVYCGSVRCCILTNRAELSRKTRKIAFLSLMIKGGREGFSYSFIYFIFFFAFPHLGIFARWRQIHGRGNTTPKLPGQKGDYTDYRERKNSYSTPPPPPPPRLFVRLCCSARGMFSLKDAHTHTRHKCLSLFFFWPMF